MKTENEQKLKQIIKKPVGINKQRIKRLKKALFLGVNCG